MGLVTPYFDKPYFDKIGSDNLSLIPAIWNGRIRPHLFRLCSRTIRNMNSNTPQAEYASDAESLQKHIRNALAIRRPTGPWQAAAYRYIKRVYAPELFDVQNIPDKPCLFVGNHSLFALDGMILIPTMLAETGRFLRSMGDKFMWNEFTEQALQSQGGIIGHPDVCGALMQDGRDLLVYPGGAHEATKTAAQKYTLQWKQRYGFVKLAAKYGYTIIPVAMVGPDEFYDHRIEGEDLLDTTGGKLLQSIGLIDKDIRADLLPPIPSGLFGTLWPKPQKCYMQFGKPIDLSRYEGKELSRRQLQTIRNKVSKPLEEMIADLLERQRNETGVVAALRGLFTA